VYITVSDALKLPTFQNAQVIAGSGGLDRKIFRISVVECPEFPIDYEIAGATNQLFANGDFFISSMYAIKDSPDLLLDTIKLYHQFNSSGLVLVPRYFPQIPQEVIHYANEVNYPLISLEKTTAYADVISDVMKAIFAQQHSSTSVMLLDQILENDYDAEKVERLAYTLNQGFQRHLMAFHLQLDNEITAKNNVIVNSINNDQHMFAINYHHTILGFYTTEKPIRQEQQDYLIKSIRQLITKYASQYHMGISDVHEGPRHLKKSIEQAVIASRTGLISGSPIAHYSRIGSYKLLLQMKNREILRQFYAESIAPLKQYDEEKKGDLLNTMICYVKNSGDLKKTAAELFQHENTVRYRLNRISQLWNKENCNLEFYENLSLAYKVHQILFSEDTGLLPNIGGASTHE
jgi:hypothetical protein